MFQSFSGNSRRPRQVNLSGHQPDPFSAWGASPTASGTQKTVAVAQAERQLRQQERERLNATKQIQRTWRGHKSRKDLANIRRQEWDESQNGHTRQGKQRSLTLNEELRLLLSFFNAENPEDISRLSNFGERLLQASQEGCLKESDIRPQLLRLAHSITTALLGKSKNFSPGLLHLLILIIESDSRVVPRVASEYYAIVASVIQQPSLLRDHKDLILTAIRVPLIQRIDIESRYEVALSAYSAFALVFLPTAYLSAKLGGFGDVSAYVDTKLLSAALIRASTTNALFTVQPELRLWLLAHFICLQKLQKHTNLDPVYMKALSVLLSSSASEIVDRIDVEESEDQHPIADEDDEGHGLPLPLPRFVKESLVTLVDKQSITGLLEKFNTDYTSTSILKEEDDASMLASYALMLLRIFPNLGEEIRMWLYQGSVTMTDGSRVPAVKLFWRVMSTTSTFSAISGDSTSAVRILRQRPQQKNPTAISEEDLMRERDWRAILLFLELYAFVLKFTDDEEFLSGGAASIIDSNRPSSRSRQSALPLQDVKLLTMFLKNLSFTMFYNYSELVEDNHIADEGSLGNYFGTSSHRKSFQDGIHPEAPPVRERSSKKYLEDRSFLGIPGMTFKYVRGIVTRVMRMLYERDSRRRFLPKDHWLMTSRFDMEGFIPAVVMEEDRARRAIAEDGDEDDDVDDHAIPLNLGRRDLIGTQRSRRIEQLESLRKQQQKTARRKMQASIAPRLEILQNMPYVIPFATRVQIFRQFVYQDQLLRRNGFVDPDLWRMAIMHGEHPAFSLARSDALNKHHAKIRRDEIFENAYEQFYRLGEGLKEPIQITFVDKFDTVEAGIDGGGVTKEFLTSITNEAFHTSNGSDMFVTNDQNLLYPNPAALDEKQELLRLSGIDQSSLEWRENMTDFLRHYEFLGRIVGKCLYEGILVDISFAGFFLLKWASTNGTNPSSHDTGYLASINDLRDLDESLYQGLLQLKNYDGDVSDFALDFTINDTVSMPGEPTRTITRNLLPNGSNIPVTNENRPLYITGVARHRLHVQPFRQTQAFLRGLWDIINPSWLSMFNQAELQTLVGGDSSEIDVDDLRRNTIYSGLYEIGDDGQEAPTIKIFWEVMKKLDDSDRRKVLKYVTSTPRAPLLGFSQLNPRFSIRDAGSDQQRLPSTSTCINLLKLPRYQSAVILKEKLLYAVNSGAGFDLS